MSSWPNHLQSPGVPSHTQVREPQSAMRHQEQSLVQGLWSPRSAMEVMNESGRPRKSGRGRPMWPAPLTSGGLTLEEITCRGWGPHLQYSFLIKLASLSGKYSIPSSSIFFCFPTCRHRKSDATVDYKMETVCGLPYLRRMRKKF